MKRKYYYVFALLFGAILFTSCNKDNSDVNPNQNFDLDMYASAKEVAPEFKTAEVTKFSKEVSGWSSGNPIYEIFFTLREFDPAIHQGLVGWANMYNMLYDVTSLWDQLYGQGEPITPPITIVPPYDFGNNYTYGYVKNIETSERAVAYSDDYNAMLSWIWRDLSNPLKAEYGVLEVVFGDTINDLFTLDYVFSVDYDTTSTETEYNLRAYLSGSMVEHSFEYRFVKGGETDQAYMLQMVAKGISQGEGNYFLFKVKDNESLLTPRYFVISAEATEADLQAMDLINDSYEDPADLPASVADYKNYVVNTAFFEYSDLVVNTNQLNAGNAKTGTIYIDY